MVKIKEVIVVEGRYDKNTLSQVVDAVILETSGFGIFNDAAKRRLLQKMAEERGIIILTDSDGAGFLIRNHLKGCLDPGQVKHAYIPEIYGKERRLGVEGMSPAVLLEALRRAGATFEESDPVISAEGGGKITKADLYLTGLCGREGSAEKRRSLLLSLALPEKLSTDALLDVLNVLMSREEFLQRFA